jgi:hypothetical protein
MRGSAVTIGLLCCVLAGGITSSVAAAEGVPPVTDLIATAGADQVALSWTNPADDHFSGVVVRMTEGSEPPASPTDGALVYDGAEASTTVTGLARGAWYSFAAFSYDSTTSYGDPATASVRTPVGTTLSIVRSPATVTYGQSVAVAGRLTVAGTATGVPDAPVGLYYRRRGATRWIELKTVTTSTTGRWSTAVIPAWHLDYAARYIGTTDFLPAASARVGVTVHAALSARQSATAVKLGGRVTLAGRVAPNHQGQQVHMQRYSSGAWRAQSSAALSATSSYSFLLSTGAFGVFHYRVVKPADDDHARAVTSKRRLQVYARTYTYNVCFRGTIVSDKAAFSNYVATVYGHPRGWARAGKRFVRIDTSCSRSKATSDLTVWLAAADKIPTFPGCYDTNFSCRSGDNVVINQTRWRKGARARGWDLGLASYRALVINHETGHWFYLRHTGCPGAGRLAPVMQQQSVSLRGCLPNPWPTAREVQAATRSRI